jgi:hypothetical protein
MDQGTVHIVPTLHQYHAAASGYGFDALTKVLENLQPHVLVVELTDAALRQRRPQRVKQEYQHSVFPYLERHGIPAVAMEPGEPLFSELVGQGLEAQTRVREHSPERYALHVATVADEFRSLLRSWDSPAAVNSPATDQVLEAKHTRENRLFGPGCERAWIRWNEHYAQAIATTAEAHPGRRIAVLVGVEHGYWLRPRLAELARASGAWSLAPRTPSQH